MNKIKVIFNEDFWTSLQLFEHSMVLFSLRYESVFFSIISFYLQLQQTLLPLDYMKLIYTNL